ncbi:tagaturonate reductase [Sphingomonas sp. PP-CE-1A-559]|uniref:mannitol dehydrogenase family protein n=1 Tax=Sphingomonas sp. PP-CE-1A-559 TaxID=2135657 RepID=UPI00105450A1|nr:mannitol dehydrogenase family protein [Sphingomonas sp. PP-CE-1A-559]TCP86008.1 tagaturonate reductase [Sphingomonas sp. PP-CE-1A-559]
MILQFGTSRFLQAHVDLFASEARDAGQTVADIAIVQVSDDPVRAQRLAAFDDAAGFPVVIRGLEGGVPVERTVQVRSVVQGLAAAHDWSELCALFVGQVTHVVSNTGDHGYMIPPEDRITIADDRPPRSFPAILLALLHRRWRFGGAGVTFLPCELVAGNGHTLRATVRDLAEQLRLPPAFVEWLGVACLWVDTLVDRIVSEPIHPAGAVAEPYALWAIRDQPGLILPFTHQAIVVTDDLPRFERLKLHILNLGHSWLAERWYRAGMVAAATVRQAMADADTLADLRRLYTDEVVPGFATGGLDDEAATYVEKTMDRFANPFIDHRLSDIYASHAAKVAKRVSGFVDWVDASGSAVPMPELRALAQRYEVKQ